MGTTWYISPEQRNREKYGKEVDIYALGIIYFEMNCPFETAMEREKVIKHEIYVYVVTLVMIL